MGGGGIHSGVNYTEQNLILEGVGRKEWVTEFEVVIGWDGRVCSLNPSPRKLGRVILIKLGAQFFDDGKGRAFFKSCSEDIMNKRIPTIQINLKASQTKLETFNKIKFN